MIKNGNIWIYLFILMGMLLMLTNSCKKVDPVIKKDVVIAWANPADITIGTALSTTQLNATADVAGKFVYTPAVGTDLRVGPNQNLKVDFTPTDTVNYNPVSKTVMINVTAPVIIAMVNIPAGTFTMGSSTNEVNHESNETMFLVTLSAFKMSKYEITNVQYAAFLNTKGIGSDGKYTAGSYPTQALIYESSGSSDWGLHYTGGQWSPVEGYENNPVINVTWYGATEFATYSGGTLPTEAQWEYACRAGTTTPFNTGNFLTNLQANYHWAHPYNGGTNTVTTYPGKTQVVGTYSANVYGLHDMHGNVFEWCTDWYGDYFSIAQSNPAGAATGLNRVFRGGSWCNLAQSCRSACRDSNNPAYGSNSIGFRLVLPQ